jgi:hypothetical protein
MSDTVPFDLVAGHLTRVPVTLDDRRPASFVLDTGIGLTVVAERVRAELGHPPSGAEHAGRRMSGQEIVVPLTELNALTLGTRRRERPEVGCFDLSALGDIDGFLSLTFFDGAPVTLDYVRSVVVLEDARSLRAREHRGRAVPAEVRRDGPSTEVYVDLTLPSGAAEHVEVDTGSDLLILHNRYLAELRRADGATEPTRREGIDETGHPYVRLSAELPGTIRLGERATTGQLDPRVIFQEIIHDGLIGRDFLRAFAVTFDLARGRLIVGPPG